MENKHNTKKEVFTVPEGYFEQLNNDILKATVGNNVATPRHKRHVIGRFYRLTACAAAVAILYLPATCLHRATLQAATLPKQKAHLPRMNISTTSMTATQ